jgi:hypothetical protein
MLKKKKHMRHELNPTCRWIRSNGTTERHVRTFLLSLTQPSHDHISQQVQVVKPEEYRAAY